MLETSRGYSPEYSDDTEEEDVDVEQVIDKHEEQYADFITGETEDRFNEIFDAARRTYADSAETRKEWDDLFENLRSELQKAEDEDELETILDNYKAKANKLG